MLKPIAISLFFGLILGAVGHNMVFMDWTRHLPTKEVAKAKIISESCKITKKCNLQEVLSVLTPSASASTITEEPKPAGK